jgi:hypothetical protein
MSVFTARAATAHARKYMIQLCKHWSHKFEVSYDDEKGRIALPAGPLALEADAEGLTLTLDAPEDQQERLQGVVADHLNRFAFREPFELAWSPAQ